ncbi:unnamed protein product [Ilex paraguariensis]|uniref:Uncharacterized protein n=1 Tax=Ilex paraguariensis TaxID=185542 RepID=A0ABC8URA0_9AQUA
MAFHVACPVTCRRICYCSLGFPRKTQGEKPKTDFLEVISRVEEFLKDPWFIKAREQNDTVQVKVPKVVVVPPPPVVPAVGDGGGGGGDGEELLSAQTKRATMQRKASAASVVAEDYARRFESGDLVVRPVSFGL